MEQQGKRSVKFSYREIVRFIRGKLLPDALSGHKDERDAENLHCVWLLGIYGMVGSLFMLLVSFLTGNNIVAEGASVYYILVFVYYMMLSDQFQRRAKRNPLVTLYILFAVLLASEILIETSLQKDKAAFIFPVFLIVFPVFLLDYPLRILIFEVVFSLIYFGTDLSMKQTFVVQTDILRILMADLAAFFVYTYLVSRRVSLMTVTKDTRNEATHDALTGIYNRGGGQSEIRELLASNVSGTFILLDIDNFKHVNDTYGHEMGDEALKAVANILSANFRKVDVVMRMGGDEFIVYAVGMVDVHFVEDKMSHVKEAMHTIILDKNSGDHVSISAGCIINLGSYHDYDSLYTSADKLLYHTKQHGKDGFTITDREYSG